MIALLRRVLCSLFRHRIRIVARCCACAARFTVERHYRLHALRWELASGVVARCPHCHTSALVLRPGCASPAVGLHITIGISYPEAA